MKNLLIIVPRLHNNLHYRVMALKNAGYNVSVVVWRESDNERRDVLIPDVIGYSKIYSAISKYVAKKVKSEKIKHLFDYQFALINIRKLRKKIRYYKPDVIIIRGTPSISVILTLILVMKTDSGLFMFIQTNKHDEKGIKKKIAVFVLKNIFRIKAIITPIRSNKETTHPYFKYIPFVIDRHDFEKTYFKNNKINIISVGKFTVRKDHLLLLMAFKKLRKKYNISLTIIGEELNDVYWHRINDFIKIHELERHVTIIKNMSHEELLTVYKDYDLFVLPSYNEPAAFTPLEAMINKLPVIVSDSCGTQCYIQHGVNGYVFKNKNIDDLEEKVRLIIDDKNRIVEMGMKSYEIAKTNHSLQVYSKQIKEIID